MSSGRRIVDRNDLSSVLSRQANPFDHLKSPADVYDLQISDHLGFHPRVNIGIFYVRSSNASQQFFTFITKIWLRYGKGGFLSDQRMMDALLKNFDRLDRTYSKVIEPVPSLNWTTHAFGMRFLHLKTDGNAFLLFDKAESLGIRSRKYYGDQNTKYFTVTVLDK